MPYWYYEKKELRHTPSVSQGISLEDETMYRREGARFILQLGNKMGLRYETMATGVVYFHRFYMVHTFQEFPRHVTACCCLFLAGKVEETPKKCKDIMRHARALVEDATWAEFGGDPREEVMTLERILLQTIKFDFIVDHPYTYLLKYAKCLKGDKKKLQSMVQMAWTFVNDGLCTTLCLQWEPEIIAIALMYLAGKLNKFEVTDWQGRSPKHQKWWDMFVQGISMELLEDICHQVLDLYSPNKSESAAAAAASASASSGIPGGASNSGSSIPVVTGTPGSGIPTVGGGVVVPVVTSTGQAQEGPPVAAAQKGTDVPKGGPPSIVAPAPKKAKKEEHRTASPVPKVDPPVTQAAPYPYPYSYPGYTPAYPPPQATTPAVATPPPRYPYYPPSSSQQHPPPQNTVPPSHSNPPPMKYQPPPSRYPPTVPTNSPPHVPPPHYTVQPPPQTHYATSHAPPYRPPPSGGAPHYPPPPTATHRPPPSHYSHASASSSYYPGSTHSPASIPPSYQQPPSGSYPPPSASYSHSSSARQYYPPST